MSTGRRSTTICGPRGSSARAVPARSRREEECSRRNSNEGIARFEAPGALRRAPSCQVAADTGRGAPGASSGPPQFPMRIIGLAGWSGSGKTTLLAKVIPRIVARGLRVSTLKHAHHGFDVDQPGKDSHTHRMAGASEVLVSSANRSALVHELRGQAAPALGALLATLSPVDLVLIEGYKAETPPKLEGSRAAVGKPLLHPNAPAIVAVASDEPLPAARVPVVDLDDVERIADLLIRHAAPIQAVLVHAGQGGWRSSPTTASPSLVRCCRWTRSSASSASASRRSPGSRRFRSMRQADA